MDEMWYLMAYLTFVTTAGTLFEESSKVQPSYEVCIERKEVLLKHMDKIAETTSLTWYEAECVKK